MKKTSICIIGVYFGDLPAYFNLWLKSCEYNKDISFLVFGDKLRGAKPANVQFIDFSISKMKELADKKLSLNTALYKPYKCCDFKVVYGIIFEDYIKNYDFWGHCDFDLVFGDIRKFATEDILAKNDKILPWGHLSLYRNTEEVKKRYMLDGSLVNYKDAFEKESSCAFDEKAGIYRIYSKNKFPMYTERIYADISKRFKRFTLSLAKDNYKNQVFYWQDGKAYRIYYKKGKEYKEEFIYIHFQKRGFNKTISVQRGFYIGPSGFTPKDNIADPSIEDIKRINPYNWKREFAEKIKLLKDKPYLQYKYLVLTDKYVD